jgi:hypothetical protein
MLPQFISNRPGYSLAEATRRNARQSPRPPRPQSQPVSRAPSRNGATTPTAPLRSDTHLSPNVSPRVSRSISIVDQSTRSQSQGAESRRISFADAPRATTRFQVKIASKNDSLSSGFPYDGQKLIKYDVSAKEWNHFSGEVVVACDAHHYNAITWPLARSKVIKKVRNDLKYGSGPDPGDVSKIFRKWNRLFRRQGFQAWLELPSEEGAEELGRSTAGMNKEEQKQAQKEAKRFRIVISPLDGKGGSIYSKSSIRGSVSGEVSLMKRANTMLSNVTKSSHGSVKEIDTKEEEEKKQEEDGNKDDNKKENKQEDKAENGIPNGGDKEEDKGDAKEEAKD